MKVGFTINLGNFESLRADSSEYQEFEDCMEELVASLHSLPIKEVHEFLDRFEEIR